MSKIFGTFKLVPIYIYSHKKLDPSIFIINPPNLRKSSKLNAALKRHTVTSHNAGHDVSEMRTSDRDGR